MSGGGTSSLRAGIIAFTTAGATLAAQILFHRIISAKLLNNYAFLVISLTMLGFASSGVILSRYLSRWLDRFNDMVALWTALFVLSSVGSSLIFYHAAIGSQRFTARGEFVSILCKTIPYALVFAIPFVFSGLLLGMLLSSPRLPARRIYCWDLVGSACGAVAVLPAISRWGVETTLLAGSGLVLIASFAVARPVRPGVRWIGGVAAVAVAVSLVWEKRLSCFVIRKRRFSPPQRIEKAA